MVSDNTFAVLRENYAAMSACYDEVMELYSSNAIAADSDMEEVSTIAHMLRTPVPCPGWPVTGTPFSKVMASSQELIICRKNFPFFSHV